MANGTVTLSEETKKQIRTVLKPHGIVRASVFGSVARGEATPESDLDILVDFPAGKTLLDLARLQRELTEALGTKVDVLTYRSLHPLIKERVMSEQVSIL